MESEYISYTAPFPAFMSAVDSARYPSRTARREHGIAGIAGLQTFGCVSSRFVRASIHKARLFDVEPEQLRMTTKRHRSG